MLCNLWDSRAGDGVTSITRYRSGPVSPFLLSQPLCNLEPLKKKKKRKEKKREKKNKKEKRQKQKRLFSSLSAAAWITSRPLAMILQVPAKHALHLLITLNLHLGWVYQHSWTQEGWGCGEGAALAQAVVCEERAEQHGHSCSGLLPGESG